MTRGFSNIPLLKIYGVTPYCDNLWQCCVNLWLILLMAEGSVVVVMSDKSKLPECKPVKQLAAFFQVRKKHLESGVVRIGCGAPKVGVVW